MRILILHQKVTQTSAPDDQDVLIQAETVSAALKSLGHHPIILSCDLNLSLLRNRLMDIQPDVVFNLVESLDGCGRLLHLVPAMLEALNIPFTGSDSNALMTTTHKTLAKTEMIRTGIPTPDWIGPFPPDLRSGYRPAPLATEHPCRKWIIKSLWEHASAGMDENAVVDANGRTVEDLVKSRAPGLGGEAFAEAYIEGREFNLSLLQDGESFQVLPPAEILFEGYPEGKPRIVDYRAKWETESYEYQHTTRRFDFPIQDTRLLETLSTLVIRCREVFKLKGYARVDFRVDAQGRPWILEVNANPCISPDAGFAAAVQWADISFEQAIKRITAAALSSQRAEKTPSTITTSGKAPSISEATSPTAADPVHFEYEPLPEDRQNVRRLVEATGFFYPDEVDVAEELVEQRLEKGDKSGYFFVFVRRCGRLIGYGAYGPIPCTVSSYDLY